MAETRNAIQPVEFVVRRIPIVRVLFGDWEDALIQVEAGEAPLNLRGTEHDLWQFARMFTVETTDAFADQALDRARAQSSRTGALEERADRLSDQLEHTHGALLVEQAVRERFERDLTARDGFNRARAKIQSFENEIRVENPTLFKVGRL